MCRINRSSLVIVLATATPQAAAEPIFDCLSHAIDAFVGQFVDYAIFDGSILVDIGGETVDGSLSLSIDDIVDRLSELPLDFEPGADSVYSHGGYAVSSDWTPAIANRPS